MAERLQVANKRADSNSTSESVFEDMDLGGGIKWELGVQPPSIKELQRSIGNAFDAKWIKYMYAHFKNECPNGRMRLSTFKSLVLPHLPAGVSDEYIERLFSAFSSGKSEVTFQALLETLAMLDTLSATAHARWIMRLIAGSDKNRVSYGEFATFVKSMCIPSDGEQRLHRADTCCRSDNEGRIIDKRARCKFAMFDKNDDGFLDLEDFVDFFEGEGRTNLQRLTLKQRQPSF